MSPGQKQSTLKLVWYASYGSNLRLERFMCYIKGGAPLGSTSARPYMGCRNKSEPMESRSISLNYELYFSGRSRNWGNGGVAFIRENQPRGLTLGRIYLITDEQFNDLVMQENSKTPDGSRFVPTFEQLVSQREWCLCNSFWYGKLLNIGREGFYPILTFTTTRTDLRRPTAPNEQYVKVIASGIKETYPEIRDADIVEYLSQADGIRGAISLAEIRVWVAAA
jgi:hypothetical protein